MGKKRSMFYKKNNTNTLTKKDYLIPFYINYFETKKLRTLECFLKIEMMNT